MLRTPPRPAIAARVRCSLWTRVLSTTPTAITQASATTTVHPGRLSRWKEEAHQFAQLPAAMQAFHESVGHWIVPYHFPIPAASSQSQAIKKSASSRATQGQVFGRVKSVHEIAWPDQVRGRLNLGRVLHKFMTNAHYYHSRHPRVKETLEEMGFPVDIDWQAYVWENQRMLAIRTFYDLYGHSAVKRRFVVPRDDPSWPVTTWGYRLGVVVDRLRHEQEELSPSQLHDLERVEFTFSMYDTEWSERLLPSLEVFAQVHGHCRVSQSFTVPHTAPYPERAWGLKLGQVVSGIRYDGAFADQVARDVEKLEAIHFVWDVSEYQWSELILPSFETFRSLHGHCRMSLSFVVPSEAPWPQEAWGLRLGKVISGMRSKRSYSDQIARDSERFPWLTLVLDPVECAWTEQILPALETFRQIVGSDGVVPPRFVVPSEAPWPRQAHGIKLGAVVEKIRSRGEYADQIARDASRFDVIGSVWEAEQEPELLESAQY